FRPFGAVGLRLAPWVAGARRVAQRPLSAGRDGPLAERQIAAHVDDVVDDGNNTGHSRTQAMQVVQENSSSGWITPPSAPIIACRSTTGATLPLAGTAGFAAVAPSAGSADT